MATMQPGDQSHPELMRVMTHLLPSYQNAGEAVATTKREGPQLEGGNPKRGRGRRAARPTTATENENVASLTNMLARMMLQHEDVLNSMLLEMELMVFMQNGEGSVLRSLTSISEQWHKQANKPQGSQLATRSPLRVVMAQCFFKELEARSAKVASTRPDADRLRQELVKQQLLSEDGQHWLQLQWSADQERLVPTTAQPLPVKQAHDIIREVQDILQTPGILLRFHSLKQLHKTQARDGSAVVPWKMVIGHREAKASLLWQHLQGLCHNAVTQLVLTRIRQASMKRSPLAQKISQILE